MDSADMPLRQLLPADIADIERLVEASVATDGDWKDLVADIDHLDALIREGRIPDDDDAVHTLTVLRRALVRKREALKLVRGLSRPAVREEAAA